MYSSPYGSPYGSYGGMGYGGMGMGMGMPGYGTAMPGLDPSQSLTAQLSNTTAQTFTLLHSIVQTFGGFAQMLDSTFMATHSSFFAMVGVIDQFAALRDVLGQVLGVFGLVRWVKGVLSGEGVVPRGAMAKEFEAFVNHQQHGGGQEYQFPVRQCQVHPNRRRNPSSFSYSPSLAFLTSCINSFDDSPNVHRFSLQMLVVNQWHRWDSSIPAALLGRWILRN
ncbi:Peroxisomal membrane protein PAS20 [Serendipita sp. 401]|nr:Peroxisomal membrane protein PAS20 [Serendipita sp. 401]